MLSAPGGALVSAGLPRATMPGQLLALRPPLSPELEYRFMGRSLLLVDVAAQLVVDILPAVLPVPNAATMPRYQ